MERESREEIIRFIRENKLVAIVRGVDPGHILDTARAVSQGGIRCLEITIGHQSQQQASATYKMISMVREQLGDQLKVGAGTVLTPQEVKLAASAGAQYIISPNTDRCVIEQTIELGMASMPGAMTPSEVVQAHQWGADFVKLFPAGLFGTSYIKAMRGPLGHIPLVAVGGVTPENCRDFLKAGCIGLGIGGNLIRLDLVARGDYESIRKTAEQFTQAAAGEETVI